MDDIKTNLIAFRGIQELDAKVSDLKLRCKNACDLAVHQLESNNIEFIRFDDYSLGLNIIEMEKGKIELTKSILKMQSDIMKKDFNELGIMTVKF